MPKKITTSADLKAQYTRQYKRITQAIRRAKKLGYSVPETIKPVKPSKVEKLTKSAITKLSKITPTTIRNKSINIFENQQSHGSSKSLQSVKNISNNVTPHHIKTPRNKTNQKLTQEKSKTKTSKTKTPKTPQQTKQKPKKQPTPEDTIAPKSSSLNMAIIDKMNGIIDNWQPRKHWHGAFLHKKAENYFKMYTLWHETLDNEGEYEVAFRLEQHASEIIELANRLLYDSDAKSVVGDTYNMARFIELIIGRTLTQGESDLYSEQAYEYAQDITTRF